MLRGLCTVEKIEREKAKGERRGLELPCCLPAPQCVNVLLRQLYDELVAAPGPAIALHAPNQPFAVVVDLDQRPAALRTDCRFVIHTHINLTAAE